MNIFKFWLNLRLRNQKTSPPPYFLWRYFCIEKLVSCCSLFICSFQNKTTRTFQKKTPSIKICIFVKNCFPFTLVNTKVLGSNNDDQFKTQSGCDLITIRQTIKLRPNLWWKNKVAFLWSSCGLGFLTKPDNAIWSKSTDLCFTF